MAKVDHDRALAWAREHRDMNDPAPAGNAARAYLAARTRVTELEAEREALRDSLMATELRVACIREEVDEHAAKIGVAEVAIEQRDEARAECERLRRAIRDWLENGDLPEVRERLAALLSKGASGGEQGGGSDG